MFANFKNIASEMKQYLNWLETHKTIDVSKIPESSRWMNLDFSDTLLSSPDYNVDSWREMELPTLWEGIDKVSSGFNGVVWYKKDIQVPAEWIGHELILQLGPIDDMDITYVNGVKVGENQKSGLYQVERSYKIPAEVVKDGKLSIAVRVMDPQGGGGIYGAKEKLNVHPVDSEEKVSLAGTWKYLPVADYQNMKFYLFDIENQDYYSRPEVSIILTQNTPTSLYNGMINPLVPYSIRGAIWYQGEANVGDPVAYETLFPLMIKNWREDWGEGDFPFYFVQIAPYDYGQASESQKLRDAQRKSLSVPNTGMAVTLDIGDAEDIHPSDKIDVGERLARWALAKTYEFENVDFSGPLYKSMIIENGTAIISFDYVDKLVYQPSKGTAKFWIAGTDKKFKEAKVIIDGNKLLVSNSEIAKPVAVRYGWSNTASATLFDEEGLPASSFRTDEW